jgi:hypothetical protein
VSERATRGIVVTLLALAGVMACGHPVDVGGFSVDGPWGGTVFLHTGSDSVGYLFRLDLAQNGHAVSGNGAVVAGTDSVQTDVSGEWDYPHVLLQLSSDTYEPLQFNGAFTAQSGPDTLRGPLVGSGFAGATLTLVRQTP